MSRITSILHAATFWLIIVCAADVSLLHVTSAAAQRGGSLGLLSFNAGGGGETSGASWETRAARVAEWAQQNGIVPDIIALQELYGWLWTPPIRDCGRGFAAGLGDYDQIDHLLKEFSDRIGIIYRVAYMTGKPATFGDIACHIYGAQAVLYNPARLVNLTAQEEAPYAHDAVRDLDRRPHLRRSLPLCNRGTRLMPLQDLIDGRPQTDKCGRETPSGPAWAVFRNEGTSPPASSAWPSLAIQRR
jgi:hypothetical protein